jgi:hypothetical protein
MPYKFNPFTGTLDFYSGSGVQGPTSSTDTAIARWNGVGGNLIQDSKALVQNGGGIEAQAFLTNRSIDETVQIKTNFTMIASNIEVNDGEVVIEADGELLII